MSSLKKWKQKERVLLELGVFKGSSLKMWEDYFGNATIYGGDCNPNCLKYESERCKVIIGDLGSEDFLDQIAKLSPNIIIDDLSHL